MHFNWNSNIYSELLSTFSVNFAKLNFNYFTEWTIQSHSICSRFFNCLILNQNDIHEIVRLSITMRRIRKYVQAHYCTINEISWKIHSILIWNILLIDDFSAGIFSFHVILMNRMVKWTNSSWELEGMSSKHFPAAVIVFQYY